MSNLIELKVPDIGGHNNVDVIEVFIQPGQTIAEGDALIALETDKATMEVPAEAAGVVKAVKVKVGGKISEGSLIATLEPSIGGVAANNATKPHADTVAIPTTTISSAAPIQDSDAEGEAAEAVRPAASAASSLAASVLPPIDEASFAKAHAGPAVRRLARELGVNLGQVTGSGHKGRILDSDVKAFVKNRLQSPMASARSGSSLDLLPWPQVDFARFGPIQTRPLSRIQKISGSNLSRNWAMIPHVTVHDEYDITELDAFRKQIAKEYEKSGQKVSPLAFIIKASTVALKAFPALNSSLDGDNLVLKQYYHIGFAADTPSGLVVPVIKDADQKGLIDIAQALTTLSGFAREGKLKPADMQGATFTISSLGSIGGTQFTPIINAPEVAILGVCKAQIKPIWNGSAFEPRLMCPLSLSFDHRVIDGAAAMRFTVYLGKLLSDVRRLIL